MRKRRASRLRWVLVLASVLLWTNEPASAQPAVQRGYILVRAHCSQCHAIDRSGASPLATATSFRTLRLRYPVADLQRPLIEGIHPVMPRFQLTSSILEFARPHLRVRATLVRGRGKPFKAIARSRWWNVSKHCCLCSKSRRRTSRLG